MNALFIAARIASAIVLAVAAESKVRNGRAFRAFVTSFSDIPFLSERSASLVGGALVCAEIGISTVLLVPALSHAAAWAALGLFILFTAGVSLLVLRGGQAATCRCFGAKRALSGRHITRNLLLVGIGAVGCIPLNHRPVLSELSLGIAIALVAGGTVIRWDELVELFVPVPSTMRQRTLRRPQPHG